MSVITREYLSTSSVFVHRVVSLALDQIKQHIDLQISSLTQELLDLIKAVEKPVVPLSESVVLPSTPVIKDEGASTTALTNFQLQTVAQRLSRLVLRDRTQNRLESSVLTTPLVPEETGQNTRRDLGTMRQLYG